MPWRLIVHDQTMPERIGTMVYVIEGGPQPGFAFSSANEAIDLASLRR